MKHSAVITGCGAVVPRSLSPLLDASFPNETSRFDSPPEIPEITGFDLPESAPEHAFEIDDFSLEDHIATKHPYIDRTSALALAAAAEALREADLVSDDGKVTVETGCCFATAFGCLDSMKLFAGKLVEKNPKFAPPLPFTHSYPNSPSAMLAIQFGLQGHSLTFAGGVPSGTQALLAAVRAIHSGMAQRVLVVASDALTEPRFLHLFSAGKLSSRSGEGGFSDMADGVVAGEGAVAVVVESERAAKRRGVEGIARILGGAQAAGLDIDPVQPALKEAIRIGMQHARVRADEIDLVQLSGPDNAEFNAVERHAVETLPTDRGQAALASVRYWSGDLGSATPLAGVVWSARILATGPERMLGIYRPGTRENLKLAMVQSLQSCGDAATAFVASMDFV